MLARNRIVSVYRVVRSYTTITCPPQNKFVNEVKLRGYPKSMTARLSILNGLCRSAMQLNNIKQLYFSGKNRQNDAQNNGPHISDHSKDLPKNNLNPYEIGLLVAGAFEDANIPYAMGGAIAYGLWGTPRATNDVDMNIFVSTTEEIRNVISSLLKIGEFNGENGEKITLDDADRLAEEGKKFACFRVFFEGVSVEFFTSNIAYSDVAMQRRVRITDELGRQCWFLDAESIVYFKLVMNRSKDHEDIYHVLMHQPKLDRMHVVNNIIKNFKDDGEGREKRLQIFLSISQKVDANRSK